MPLSLDLYYRLFQLECRQKRGMEFQTFFETVMQRHDPAFIAIKPKGSEGDRKCDGYSLAGTVYQCYAPEELKRKDLEQKIRADLAGAVTHWPEMQRWVFLYVQSDNVYAETAELLEALIREHPRVAIECWSSARWWDEVVRTLPLDVLAELFPSGSGALVPEPIQPTVSSLPEIPPRIEAEPAFVLLVDSAGYTPQANEHGAVATGRFERALFEALGSLGAKHGLRVIRTFGDAVLFYGNPGPHGDVARPIEFYRELGGGKGLGLDTKFQIALRCVLHFGGCAVERDASGLVVYFTGAEVVQPFRLEKHANAGELLLTSEAWQLCAHLVDEAALPRVPLVVAVPKGFEPPDPEMRRFLEGLAKHSLAEAKAVQAWGIWIVGRQPAPGHTPVPSHDSPDEAPVAVTEQMYPKARQRLLEGLKNRELSTAALTLGADLFQSGPGGWAEPRPELGLQRIRLQPFLQRLENALRNSPTTLRSAWQQLVGDLLVFAVDPAWTAQARRNWPSSSIPYHGDLRYTITAGQKTVFFVRLIVCAVCDSPCEWNSLIDTREKSDRCLPDDDHFRVPPLPVVPPNILPSQTPYFVKRALVSHAYERAFADTEDGKKSLDEMFASFCESMACDLLEGRKTYYATDESYSKDGMDVTLKAEPYSLHQMPIFRANDKVETAMAQDAYLLPPQLHRLHLLFTAQA